MNSFRLSYRSMFCLTYDTRVDTRRLGPPGNWKRGEAQPRPGECLMVAFRCAFVVCLLCNRRAPSPGRVLGAQESLSLNLQALYYACSEQLIAWEIGVDVRGNRGG